MGTYATEKRALGICDRCGFTFKLRELIFEYNNDSKTGLRVCKACLDPDHPQNDLGKYPIYDPEGLENPRSDSAEREASRAIRHNVRAFPLRMSIGQVTVVTT